MALRSGRRGRPERRTRRSWAGGIPRRSAAGAGEPRRRTPAEARSASIGVDRGPVGRRIGSGVRTAPGPLVTRADRTSPPRPRRGVGAPDGVPPPRGQRTTPSPAARSHETLTPEPSPPTPPLGLASAEGPAVRLSEGVDPHASAPGTPLTRGPNVIGSGGPGPGPGATRSRPAIERGPTGREDPSRAPPALPVRAPWAARSPSATPPDPRPPAGSPVARRRAPSVAGGTRPERTPRGAAP